VALAIETELAGHSDAASNKQALLWLRVPHCVPRRRLAPCVRRSAKKRGSDHEKALRDVGTGGSKAGNVVARGTRLREAEAKFLGWWEFGRRGGNRGRAKRRHAFKAFAEKKAVAAAAAAAARFRLGGRPQWKVETTCDRRFYRTCRSLLLAPAG
jgi:hypothetical protein